MKRLPLLLSVLALLAAVAAIAWVFTREPPPAEEVPLPLARSDTPATGHAAIEMPKGGIHLGIVVDRDGKPVEGATVLLVAYDAGDQLTGTSAADQADPDVFDPRLLPVVGFRTAAEGRTDAGGRFRIAADAASAVRLVAAYKMGYVPALLPAAPLGSETAGGAAARRHVRRPRGRRGDGSPVPAARITLYLQQKARVPDARPGEQTGARASPSRSRPSRWRRAGWRRS